MRISVALVGIFLVVVTAILVACSRNAIKNTAIEPPETACQMEPPSWQGIVPGQSNKADVVEILGQPVEEMQLGEAHVFTYPPILELASSYGNMIGFRKDDVVDWVDMWVLDSDGEFHTVAEIAHSYGTTLDRVYVNGSFDLFGPDQVYVWSECGVAVTAVPDSVVKRSDNETLLLAKSVDFDVSQLTFRHPVHPQASVQPRPDVQQIVSRQFLFEPTSFASFEAVYADKIPYLDKQYYQMRLAE
jgi:hypothetical protein